MSHGTTQIDQLPTISSSNGGNNINSEPVQLTTSSDNVKVQNYGQQLNSNRENEPGTQVPPIDYTSQLHSVLKDAESSGATVLPSRDIPQNTLPIQQDYQAKADFVPDIKSNDYIGNILDKEQIIMNQKLSKNKSDNFDYLFEQIQLPLLIGILYFLFQLPFIRKNLFTFLPNLFNKDGTPKLSGYLFNSLMFALFYSAIIYSLNYLKM